MGAKFNGGQGYPPFHVVKWEKCFYYFLSPTSFCSLSTYPYLSLSLSLSLLDSVWPVYILPEEVGSRLSIIGTNVVALKSGGNGKIGHLDIYNPGDPSTPLISWDRDKMRRTGKTGHLVFIEIGRRCQGGPGLVWMYTGFNDAQALRETLHK